MFAQLKKALTTFVLCSLLFFSAPISVSAQEEVDSEQFTFLQIGVNEMGLAGPYDSRTFFFGLPADWKLDTGGELQLLMGVSFNQPQVVTKDANIPVVVSGGTMTVEFNNVVIGVIPLNQVGEVQERLTIPVEALQPTRTDGRMRVDISLDSGLSCFVNQQMTVIVHSGSNFAFPHSIVTPDTSLVNFPRPLYQASIVPDATLVVVPDKPSAAELRSAFTVAAGLSNLTGGNVPMDLATVSELTPTQVENHDLIVVGKANSMPLLSELTVPANVVSGKFKESTEDDGVIQMVNSPWNPANVVLLVGGNTDQGVVKAAQAISTGVIRSGAASNLSIVESVQPDPIDPTLAVFQTFADLGYGDNELTRYGSNTASYRFYVPPGASISEDAYFELVYTHSALLDYESSGIVVLLNNRPIGSARFTDTTAGNSTNHLRVSIPPVAILPGNNVVTVNVNLSPLDFCSDPSFQGLWAMIWSDSFLNLPLGSLPAKSVSLLGLDTYPAPFALDSTLGSSAFLVQKDNPDAWRAALQMAGFLGDRANGGLTTLETFYADEIPAEAKEGYNMLIVGQPSKLPVMAEINDTLPAPFLEGGDIASQANMQVSFRVPSSSPVGYLQMVSSPWNPDKVVLTVAGNSAEGLRWAGSALGEPSRRSSLAGNFAVIDGTQVLTADTRLLAQSQNPVAAAPTSAANEAVSQPQPVNLVTPSPLRPTWILPTLVVSVVTVVLVLLGLAVAERRNGRGRPKAKPKES